MDVGTNPPVVNVVSRYQIKYIFMSKKNNKATIAVYIVKIIQIVESNCLN
jgi:hypothetical protein